MATDTSYKKSVEEAIANPKLSKALHLFGDAYLIARENAYRGLDFEAMRSELAEIKDLVRVNRKEKTPPGRGLLALKAASVMAR